MLNEITVEMSMPEIESGRIEMGNNFDTVMSFTVKRRPKIYTDGYTYAVDFKVMLVV